MRTFADSTCDDGQCQRIGGRRSHHGHSRVRHKKLRACLLQLRVLCLGLLQHGNFRIGIFPQGQEVFVSGQRPHAGSVGIGSLQGFGLQRIGAGQAQACQCAGPAVGHNAAVIEDLMKLAGSGTALFARQVSFPARIDRNQARRIVGKWNQAEFDGRRRLQFHDGTRGIARGDRCSARIDGSHKACICVPVG